MERIVLFAPSEGEGDDAVPHGGRGLILGDVLEGEEVGGRGTGRGGGGAGRVAVVGVVEIEMVRIEIEMVLVVVVEIEEVVVVDVVEIVEARMRKTCLLLETWLLGEVECYWGSHNRGQGFRRGLLEGAWGGGRLALHGVASCGGQGGSP